MIGMRNIYLEQSTNNILQIPYSVMIVRLVHPIVVQVQEQVILNITGIVLVMEHDLHVQIKMIALQ